MIILDTNVISELVKPALPPQVADWFRSSPSGDLFTTAISVAELRFGIAVLPSGARKNQLEELIESFISDELSGQVLDFDVSAAASYAAIRSARRLRGLPMSQSDAQIAAIAQVFNATLATRNTTDFDHTGINLINPWTYQP